MSSRKKMIKLLLVMVWVVFCAAGGAEAVEWYVDDNAPGDPGPGDPTVSDPYENGSIDHPFDSIQEELNTATNGVIGIATDDDTGMVYVTTYRFGGALASIKYFLDKENLSW